MKSEAYFFGYGSLVNRTTHNYAEPRPARLTGWCRAWRHTNLRPVPFLTAVPSPGTVIEGLIARVPEGDWQALDQREWAYDRVAAKGAVNHPLNPEIEIAVYAVPAGRLATPDTYAPILLSYLDVVVQGYLREFGTDGAERFFDTTEGWESPIRNDRDNPVYPRHQQLTAQESAFVDARLAAIGARIIGPSDP